MLKNIVKIWLSLLLMLSLGLATSPSLAKEKLDTGQIHQKNRNKTEPKAAQVDERGLLVPTGDKQVLLTELDSLGRASQAHIQLQAADMPKKTREPRLTYNPTGWHNYKFYFENGEKKAWLMNRGHLVGYLFSGLNNEAENLVPITAWLNSGNYKGSKDSNDASMLYYEKRLSHWLKSNPEAWLDYRVTAIYQEDELLPRQIELQFVGLDAAGNLLAIDMDGKASHDERGIGHVVLDNVSPNAELDYKTGQATATVKSAEEQERARAYAEEKEKARKAEEERVAQEQAAQAKAEAERATALAQEEERIVYVARHGKAKVYWYSKNSMPKNTNFGNVKEMTEAQAKAEGKRHTTKEPW